MDYEKTYIGNRTIWGGEKPFGISAVDRRQHLYVIGKTGTGKTTLLKNLISQDIERGHGLALIDPHGDLAEEILDCIPPWRADHVLYFNPGDSDFPVGQSSELLKTSGGIRGVRALNTSSMLLSPP
jgi:hypothetical protein